MLSYECIIPMVRPQALHKFSLTYLSHRSHWQQLKEDYHQNTMQQQNLPHILPQSTLQLTDLKILRLLLTEIVVNSHPKLTLGRTPAPQHSDHGNAKCASACAFWCCL